MGVAIDASHTAASEVKIGDILLEFVEVEAAEVVRRDFETFLLLSVKATGILSSLLDGVEMLLSSFFHKHRFLEPIPKQDEIQNQQKTVGTSFLFVHSNLAPVAMRLQRILQAWSPPLNQ